MNQILSLIIALGRRTRLLCLTSLLALPSGLAAQDSPPAPADGAVAAPTAPAAPVLVEQNTSGHYFEYILTVIGFGAALFAVCRSSQRN